MGNPRWRIALVHIMPNIMPALLVQATLSDSRLRSSPKSPLLPRPRPAAAAAVLGSMLNAAQRFLTQFAVMAIWPGLAIFLGGAVAQLVGDAWRGRAGSTRAVGPVVIARSEATEAIQTTPRANGLLRGACHRAALRADPLARNDETSKSPSPRPAQDFILVSRSLYFH